MFSVSKIKNKKAFFLQIILLSAFSAQCYGMEEAIATALGSKDNPKYVITSDGRQEDSIYVKIAWALIPTLAGIAITQIINRWNEDPELNNLNKQEKQIELELKKHPDYPAIHLLHQKNEEQERANKNNMILFDVELKKAQVLEHHQGKISEFSQCSETGSSERERKYCEDMLETHKALIKRLISTQ